MREKEEGSGSLFLPYLAFLWILSSGKFSLVQNFAEMRPDSSEEISWFIFLCLHQSNVYIKGKLWVWRAQKCHFLVGAKTVLTSMGLQTTLFHAALCRADNGILRKFHSTYRHGTVFPPEMCDALTTPPTSWWPRPTCKLKKKLTLNNKACATTA